MKDTYDLAEVDIRTGFSAFCFPMLFTNLMQQVYSLTDTAVIGKGLGDTSLAAVGNLSSVSLMLLGFSMGLTGGFAVITGQYCGAGDAEGVRKAAALSIKLSAFMALFLTVVGCAGLRPVLLAMNTEKEILAEGICYGSILFGGTVFSVFYNLFSGILRSLGDSRTPFFAILVSSAVNIFLDCFLIFFCRTGVEGAAAATVLSQGLSAVICWRRLRKQPVFPAGKEDFRGDAGMYLLLLKNGIPTALMNSVTAVGCMIVQSVINRCGISFTAAYAACSRYLNFFMLPSLTAGFAVSAFVSQNYGAQKPVRIRQAVHAGAETALISCLITGTGMAVFPVRLAGFMLNESRTIRMAAGYLRICGASLILLGLLFVYRNAVQGMGRPFVPMFSGILEMALRIPVITVLLPGFGFDAAAWAERAAWAGALALNLSAYVFYMNRMIRQKKEAADPD